MIRFENIHKRFDDKPVLCGVDLTIARGSVHFVMGRSGAGKSVLIKQVVGLTRPDSGHLWFDGQDIATLEESGFGQVRQRCQLIFQHATLFDGLTALENVAMPLRKRLRLRRTEADRVAFAALAQVHAERFAERLPSELGAGLRKRVAIARALALRPDVLLYDEPTTGLDPVSARRIDRLVHEMSQTGITSVVVSHDLTSLRAIGEQVSFLSEGRVRFSGPAQKFLASTDPALVSFTQPGR